MCPAGILNTGIFYVRTVRARNPVIKVVNKRFRCSHVRLRSERESVVDAGYMTATED